MNPQDDQILIICYPGGAGGSFVSSALQSVMFGTDFKVDPDLGHCHFGSPGNYLSSLPNIFHGPTLDSFYQEIDNIQKVNFSKAKMYSGHYRNLVAIQQSIETQLGFETASIVKFITISVDPNNEDQIFFIATMLRNKVGCFPEVDFEQFLSQTTHYVKSWYWVENSYTKINTISLSLKDVFSPGLADKLTNLLTAPQLKKFQQHHLHYLDLQKKIYPDLLKRL